MENNLEKERRELQQIARELALMEPEFDTLRRKIDRHESRKNNLYIEIDRKLDGE
jgi:hypothetical protein